MKAKVRIISAVFLLTSIIGATSCTGGTNPSTTSSPPTTTTAPSTTTAPPTTLPPTTTIPPTSTTPSSVANGRNIYTYAYSLDGDPVYSTFGPGMMYFSCESCHGPDAHGGNIFLMMQIYQVPNITWKVLTGPYPDHASYTVQTFKQAVTKGLDPAGNKLDYPMPLWTISDRDLNDLISFLQTLP